MAKYAKPYLDSSAWIAWARGEIIGDVDRKAVISNILKAAARGGFKIHTSAVTLAEVHKIAGAGKEKLPPDDALKILAYFENDYIIIVDADRIVGESAHRLCAEHSTLKPNDAIHLASALRAKCDVLLAWDRPLTKITTTDIRIEEPRFVEEQTEMDNGTTDASIIA